MADKVVGMDVRGLVVTWPVDAPRGAVSRFCAEHGVSRSWFYEVRARVGAEGQVGAMQLRPRHGPARHSQAISPAVEDLAVAIRKELHDEGWDHGPVTVRHRLQEMGVSAPAVSTLARVFTRRGMVVPQPQKRPRSSYRRFSFAMVHECWQLDAFEWALADGSIATIYQVLDDCSRFLLASHVAEGETAAGALTVVNKAIAVAGQPPCLFLSDNGSAFNATRRGHTSQLVVFLQALGTRPITGRPSHPQTQGKNERVHQTTQRWLRARPRPETTTDLLLLLEQFDQQYNQHRPHQAIGLRTPALALATGPVAVRPARPEPSTRPLPSTGPSVVARRYKVAANGNLSIRRHIIQLGLSAKSTEVTVIATGHTITVFDPHGAHLRTVVLEPGKRYYGNGLKSPGRPRRPKRPD
jgi:putative transposase